ncbi:MAG: 50S ribosomal protein L2 [Planctomycetota bacterium]|nr:50S ribosomal protein L2 [Planctomycetota bacterium]
MPLRFYKPTSAGRRGASVIDYKQEITKATPEESLIEPLPNTGGRNAHGRLTARAITSMGRRRYYRKIDFKRQKDGVPAKVVGIEYDPNRTCFIALLNYKDGEKRYILAPKGLTVGQTVESGENVEPDLGNAMPLRCMPLGSIIHNIELQPGAGGKMVRAAGGEARLLAKEGREAHIVLPSGEMRKVPVECRATIGQVGNLDHQNVVLGKAGRAYFMLRKRPTTRGIAKNPVDHPMGGGSAKGKGHIPQSPTGVLAKGGKTRKNKARTNNQIIRRRKGAAVQVV